MKLKHKPALIPALLGLLILATGSASGQIDSPSFELKKPENIYCQGFERATVLIGWTDTSTDEDGYKLERSDNGGAWIEIQTRNPTPSGGYSGFNDTGTDTTHNLRYRMRAYKGTDFGEYSDICDNRRIYEPGNFRLFYGLRGIDDCPLVRGQWSCVVNVSGGGVNFYVDRLYRALQNSTNAFIRLGYVRRADESALDKVPANVMWCDGGGCAQGEGIGFSPLLIEKPFNLITREGDPAAYVVALHEMWHRLQDKYDRMNDPKPGWVIEGQARSIQDKICLGGDRRAALCFDDIATGSAGYVGEVNAYLSHPNYDPINKFVYQAVLFWTYLVEKYGTSDPGDQTEQGMNLMRVFWETSADNPGLDGISTLNIALERLGHTERFRDVWKDFAVTNYAKDFIGPAKYQYEDMAEIGGNYNPVTLTVNERLSLDESYLDIDESVKNWAAQYYQFRPDPDVPWVNLKVTQETPGNLFYNVLATRDGEIVFESNPEGREERHLTLPLLNDSYDNVTVIVVGLENPANYRIAVNSAHPSLCLLKPNTYNKARLGNMAAPDKFTVLLEVVDSDGLPMAGINLDNFSFIVGEEGSGGVTVPPGNVLNKFQFGGGQNWFVLRAPSGLSPDADGTPGTYRLTAKYGTALSDNEDDAVDYTPRVNADSVILLDRSGSMGDDNKLFNAINASRLFVDSWRTGDKLGLISFNHDVYLDMPVVDWTDDTPPNPPNSRQDAFNLLSGYSAGGGTRIGDTIWTGYQELVDNGNPTHDWALVLLSDGNEENPGTRNFDTAVQNLVNATGKKPVIHSVAIGPDADRPRMQAAASRTGGTYQYISAPAALLETSVLMRALQEGGRDIDLSSLLAPQDIADMGLSMDYRYRSIATDILGQQQIYAMDGPFDDQDPAQDIHTITVEPGAAELVLSLSSTAVGDMEPNILRDPNGIVVPPFHSDWRHIVWRVANPLGGDWTLEVNESGPFLPGTSPNEPLVLAPYLVQASIDSDVTLDAIVTTPLQDNGYGHLQLPPGQPVSLAASLTDSAPITSAAVLAIIEKPDAGLYAFWMWDDGNHADGVSDDGVYGGTFYATGQNGSYNVTIYAAGHSQSLDSDIYRSKILSFHMARVDANGDEIPSMDIDQDSVPDDWEIFFQPWTNPNLLDAGEDPDNDGLVNKEEWGNGADPGDPDSDDDGEADSTDVAPLDRNLAPVIQAPEIHAYAGVEQVFVPYTLSDTHHTIELFRDEDNDADILYDLHSSQVTPNLASVFTDSLVTNGNRYCYIVVAVDADGNRSAPSAPSCAVPSTDPLPPHGFVRINGGAQSTQALMVTLDLWASDAVDPEVSGFGPDYLPPANSATSVTQMMISNDPAFNGAAWESYAASKPWTLAQPTGLASVYVKYRDAIGNVSDTYVASIWIGRDPAVRIPVYLPMVVNGH